MKHPRLVRRGWAINGVELMGQHWGGGGRNPLVKDFPDTNGDKIIDEKDIGPLRARAIHGKPSRKFNSLYRWNPPETWTYGADPKYRNYWNISPATSGDITTKDLALVEQQRSHRCDVAPDQSDFFLNDGQQCQNDRQCKSRVCGCGGQTASYRTCQPATTIVGVDIGDGNYVDPQRCFGLAPYQWCIENVDCASNNCTNKIVPNRLVCAP